MFQRQCSQHGALISIKMTSCLPIFFFVFATQCLCQSQTQALVNLCIPSMAILPASSHARCPRSCWGPGHMWRAFAWQQGSCQWEFIFAISRGAWPSISDTRIYVLGTIEFDPQVSHSIGAKWKCSALFQSSCCQERRIHCARRYDGLMFHASGADEDGIFTLQVGPPHRSLRHRS